MTIVVDTREKPTPAAAARYKAFGVPYVQKKLDFGDYTALCTLPDGTAYSLAERCVIERKESLDELCTCYTNARPRFAREFERAAAKGAKTYLLTESATWEKAYNGQYRSKLAATALVASLTTWLARYNCTLLFCQPQTSGKLIHDVLYRELKEQLSALPLPQKEEVLSLDRLY